MNVILLTPIIFTLVLVHGGGVFYKGNNITSNLAHKRSNPCQDRSEMSAYHNFSERHILPANFKDTTKAWGEYLNDTGLCGRAPVQSFINADEKNVLLICSDAGQRLQEVDDSTRNLCISKSNMSVYDVKSKKNKNQCTIKDVKLQSHPVIVACNKIENCCLPVHYQKYDNQEPGDKPCF